MRISDFCGPNADSSVPDVSPNLTPVCDDDGLARQFGTEPRSAGV